MSYGRPCEFLGICSNFDRADSDKWQKKPCVHTELEELNSDGRDTLTYSSVRTFQACPKRYYYRYELGITRTDEGDSEALTFGRELHLHLAEYWQALMPEEKAHGTSDYAGNSLASASQEALPF
jgi:ATP-dependent helicase/DNAse subunit B